MDTFSDFRLKKALNNAIHDLGYDKPTPIQKESFNVVLSGKDILGIAQTGTGKTLAYLLPILEELKFSKEMQPRVLIIVPTKELVLQVADEINDLTKYMSIRTIAVYGGVNAKRQHAAFENGADIVVATPGRLYDLVLDQAFSLKGIKKLVIDEVDVMLDLGFINQLKSIMQLIPERRQNIMLSATMTDSVQGMIQEFFGDVVKISIAVSGTRLENIDQSCYAVENFYTKVNLLMHLLRDKETYRKVLVFVSNKRSADRIFEVLEEHFGEDVCIVHSNKSQNYRIRSVEDFDSGANRILVSTDVMTRGLDFDAISHVFSFDTPSYTENYMHRIGRTGRAEKQGVSVLFYTEEEAENKEAIESLMNYEIPQRVFPDEVEISTRLTPDERPEEMDVKNHNRNDSKTPRGASTQEKKEKNKKENQGGSYKRKLAKKYKKAQTRGDKTYHKRQKRG